MDLTSVNRKLQWARHHFDLVDREINAWLNTKPYSFTHEQNREHTKHWFRASVGGNHDFQRWGLMIGDCLTNLRDTLDHLIYSIACLSTSPHPSRRESAAFIIRGCPDDFARDSKSRLASVPGPVLDAVLNFQPFNRPHPPLLPLLQILGELANGNKHKLLLVALSTPAVIDIQFHSNSPVAQKHTFDIYKGDIKDGTVACIFEWPSPDPTLKLQPNGKIGLQVALRHKPLEGNTAFDADKTSYSRMIELLFKEVETVIATIAALV